MYVSQFPKRSPKQLAKQRKKLRRNNGVARAADFDRSAVLAASARPSFSSLSSSGGSGGNTSLQSSLGKSLPPVSALRKSTGSHSPQTTPSHHRSVSATSTDEEQRQASSPIRKGTLKNSQVVQSNPIEADTTTPASTRVEQPPPSPPPLTKTPSPVVGPKTAHRVRWREDPSVYTVQAYSITSISRGSSAGGSYVGSNPSDDGTNNDEGNGQERRGQRHRRSTNYKNRDWDQDDEDDDDDDEFDDLECDVDHRDDCSTLTADDTYIMDDDNFSWLTPVSTESRTKRHVGDRPSTFNENKTAGGGGGSMWDFVMKGGGCAPVAASSRQQTKASRGGLDAVRKDLSNSLSSSKNSVQASASNNRVEFETRHSSNISRSSSASNTTGTTSTMSSSVSSSLASSPPKGISPSANTSVGGRMASLLGYFVSPTKTNDANSTTNTYSEGEGRDDDQDSTRHLTREQRPPLAPRKKTFQKPQTMQEEEYVENIEVIDYTP